MIQQPQYILFASDLSVDMKQVFEHAVAMATYVDAKLIVLHVMEDTDSRAEKRVKMVFGEELYRNIKDEQRTGARNLLIGKNVDAVRIRHAISGFFDTPSDDMPDPESPIEKILVTESPSIADEIVSTALDENCGMIVMGSRQQGLLAEAVSRKLVRQVIKRTSAPVYVVPIKEK